MDGPLHSSAGTNLVCTALKANGAATYGASQIVLAALNQAIEGAVSDARAHHIANVAPHQPVAAWRRARHLHGRPLGLLGPAGSRDDAGV